MVIVRWNDDRLDDMQRELRDLKKELSERRTARAERSWSLHLMLATVLLTELAQLLVKVHL